MNEETFNMSIRKFLKMVGIRSQHEIEQAVAQARAQGKITGNESFPVSMSLQIGDLGLQVKFDGQISLE
jgi:hypothetical protein